LRNFICVSLIILVSKVLYSTNFHFVGLSMEIQHVLMFFSVLLPFMSINFESLTNSWRHFWLWEKNLKNCNKFSIFDITNKWVRVWIIRVIKSCAIQCMPSMCGENISLILLVTPICLCPLLCPNNGYVIICGSHYLEFWNLQHQNI
jgi:hypothetical protein